MTTRRTILKAVGAAIVAPVAFLWPKLAKGLNVPHRVTKAESGPPVKMTTWWWRCKPGDWQFHYSPQRNRLIASAHMATYETLVPDPGWDVAQYCEWAEVLTYKQLEWVKGHPSLLWWQDLEGNDLLIRCIPGAVMA